MTNKIIIFILSITLLTGSSIDTNNSCKNNINMSLKGKTYKSYSSIPVERNDDGNFEGNVVSPVELYTVDGKFYFSKITRTSMQTIEVNGVEEQEMENHYTLFEYNAKTKEYTAVSDEIGYVKLADGKFLYTRSSDMNDVDEKHYINNSSFDNEIEISEYEAKKLIKIKGIKTSNRDGENNKITFTLESNNKKYSIKPNPFKLRVNMLIGVIDDKVFFSGEELIDNGKYWRSSLYYADLKTLKIIKVKYNDEELRADGILYIGDDECIYTCTHSNKTLIKFDPSKNRAVCLAEVNDFVEEYVVCGDYIMYAAARSDYTSTIKSIEITGGK